jgi:hypothetical protein
VTHRPEGQWGHDPLDHVQDRLLPLKQTVPTLSIRASVSVCVYGEEEHPRPARARLTLRNPRGPCSITIVG